MNSLSLDRFAFDRFKGILILIIIYAHTQQLITEEIHRLLTTFYVSSFFMLPFLFNKDSLTISNILKIFRRYYVPFIWFLGLSTLLYTIVKTHSFHISEPFFLAALMGTKSYLKELTGTYYLWFLPTLISVLLLLMTYNTLKNKLVFIISMIIAHLSITLLNENILNNMPLGMAIAIYIFPLGILIHYLHTYHLHRIYQYRYFLYLLFIVLLFVYYGKSYWYILIKLPNIFSLPDLLLLDAIQICAFFTILFIMNNIKSAFIGWIGKNSLIIYTVHPLLIFLLNFLYPWETLLEGLIKISITIALSSLCVITVEKLNIKRWIYPK